MRGRLQPPYPEEELFAEWSRAELARAPILLIPNRLNPLVCERSVMALDRMFGVHLRLIYYIHDIRFSLLRLFLSRLAPYRYTLLSSRVLSGLCNATLAKCYRNGDEQAARGKYRNRNRF